MGHHPPVARSSLGRSDTHKLTARPATVLYKRPCLSEVCYNLAMTQFAKSTELVHEQVGDDIYEYYPLGKHVVIAPGICGGRPTFKYTRLEVSLILSLLARGESIEQVIADYADSRLSPEAVQEAILLAGEAFVQTTQHIYPFAA